MKYDAQGNQVADDDPNAVSDTPPAPPAPAPQNDDVMSAYREQLLAESRRNAQLQRELEEARRTPVTPPAPPTPEQEKSFFDRPVSSTRDIVREELASTVGPLNDFVQQQQRASAYTALKNQMRSMPQRFAYLTQVESIMDQMLQNATIINDNTVVAAYNTALGYFISTGGQLTAPTPTPPTPPNPNPVPPTPPHIRPTPSSLPNNPSGGKKVRALNENEKKIARYNGWNDAEYIVWSEQVSPNEVGTITPEEIKRRVEALTK